MNSHQTHRLLFVTAISLLTVALAAAAPSADYTYTAATGHDANGTGDGSTAEYTVFGTAVTVGVANGGSYDGIASHVTALDSGQTDFLGTGAVIRGGTNTGSATTVSMAWRNRTLMEVDGRTYGGVQWPGLTQYTDVDTNTAADVALAYDSYGLPSDIVDVSGINGAYVLEMGYSEAAMVFDHPEWGLEFNETFADEHNMIYLGWFETDGSAGTLPAYDEWVNAVDGNSVTGSMAVEWYKGSFDDFLVDYPAFDLTDYMGSFGCDIDTDTVWAVLDHNSPFGAVPEPTSLSLLALGGLALLRRRKR